MNLSYTTLTHHYKNAILKSMKNTGKAKEKKEKTNDSSNENYINKTAKLTFPRLQIQSSNNSNSNKVNTVSPLTIVTLQETRVR